MTECLDFTVAIPTYNGESRLPELLERLRNQLYTEQLSWEIIVVDNNSTDNTATVVQAYQENWQCPYPLKYCFEPQQGAAYARKRAVEEAKGRLIGFLDDDNYPVLDWVLKAYNFGQNYPHAGAYGSQIHPEWEVEPPENFQRIAPFLAITERGDLPLQYDMKNKIITSLCRTCRPPTSLVRKCTKSAYFNWQSLWQNANGRRLRNAVLYSKIWVANMVCPRHGNIS
jgi:glycosyltransferase involved in cell wall biosynthesis